MRPEDTGKYLDLWAFHDARKPEYKNWEWDKLVDEALKRKERKSTSISVGPDGVPTKVKLNAGEFDEGTEMARRHFFDTHIELGGGHRRFVMRRDLAAAHKILKEAKETEKYGVVLEREAETNTLLWIPSEYDEDFNLITSLATNGLHYGLYDIDFPVTDVQFHETNRDRPMMMVQHEGTQVVVNFKGPIRIYKSSSNCHVLEMRPSTLTEYKQTLASIPGEDARKYRMNIESVGYGALRVPWVKKTEQEME